jgi:hypothetical protein
MMVLAVLVLGGVLILADWRVTNEPALMLVQRLDEALRFTKVPCLRAARQPQAPRVSPT